MIECVVKTIWESEFSMNDKAKLLDKLVEYNKSDFYGFHMPGHKRNSKLFGEEIPFGIDITEIEGFDDLHHCEDILLEAQKRAAKVFAAKESFYLINGSTAGNMAAIMSVAEPGDKILIARNNHKSVYNAVFLKGLNPVYVYPQFDELNGINGGISHVEVQNILRRENGIKAVVIVSPTYDGVISDINKISEVVHNFGIPLIVDEAHGAHLGFHEYFPMNGNQLGADIVIHSVHKTLPSLTQTGLLHINGDIVNRNKVVRYLKMLQSSSPSYVLMASIDNCVNLIEKDGVVLFNKYVENLDRIRKKLEKLKWLKLVETDKFDRSKIIISSRSNLICSKEIYEILLEKYHLQMEMCGVDYVTAMTSVADTEEGFRRLEEALFEIDRDIEVREWENGKAQENEIINHRKSLVELPKLEVAKGGEEGSEWFYYLYPPGIPFVVPGEVISEEIKRLMREYEEKGFVIQRG